MALWTGSFWTYWPFGPVPCELNVHFEPVSFECTLSSNHPWFISKGLSGQYLLNSLAFGPVNFERNGPADRSLLNVFALRAGPFWTFWPFEPLFYHLIFHGSYTRAFWACTFWTPWSFESVTFECNGPSGQTLLFFKKYKTQYVNTVLG
jgi:hypothetical protein